jgi:TIR domain
VVGGVFISYRREDSGGFAGRIYDRLTRNLGHENVFFDVDSIAPGVDFVDTLSDRLGRCDVLVAVIGKSWLGSADSNNRRRLDDPTDYVRLEIEAALQRSIRVIPVLVDGAALPKTADLPESLAKLTRRQAIEISLTRFDSDVERLLEALSALEDGLHRGAGATADSAARDLQPNQEIGGIAPDSGFGGLRPGADSPFPEKARGSGAAHPPGAASVAALLAPANSSDGKRRGFAVPLAAGVAAAAIVVAGAAFYVRFGLHDIISHPWNPSFNCQHASAKAEFTICDDEQLSQLDNEVSVLYNTIRKSTTGDDLRQLDSAESVWVVERNTCENDLSCIKKIYDDRITELKQKISPKP